MENKNKPETWEIEEVLPKDSESSNRELDMPETFEINDDGTIGEKKEKTLEEKAENIEEKESSESVEEINLIFSDIENYNNKYKETSQKEEKRQGLWARLTGGKAKETEEIKSRQKEAQEIYKRLEEIEGGIFEERRKKLIEIFKKEAGEIAEERAEKVDEVIEGLNEQTSKEIEKVNKEKPGLFERISARFKKNGLEIVIALALLAMLAAMPRENALELITSGRIKSFLPIEYANLGLIASTAAVLKITGSDFFTRNIRKYFGDKTSKEKQEDVPVSINESHDEKGLDDASEEVEIKDNLEGEDEEIQEDIEKRIELKRKLDKERGLGGEKEKKKKEPKNKKYDKSFSQVAGSAEYQEAFEKYQEEGEKEKI